MADSDDTDKLHFVRTVSGLEPADEYTRDVMASWKVGQHLRCDMTKTRGIEKLRWYWGLCRVVLDNSDGEFGSLVDVSNSIKLACGCTVITQVWENGDWRIDRAPGSIAFRNMDEAVFQAFCKRASDYACAVLSVSSSQLQDALLEYIAPNYRR